MEVVSAFGQFAASWFGCSHMKQVKGSHDRCGTGCLQMLLEMTRAIFPHHLVQYTLLFRS